MGICIYKIMYVVCSLLSNKRRRALKNYLFHRFILQNVFIVNNLNLFNLKITETKPTTKTKIKINKYSILQSFT